MTALKEVLDQALIEITPDKKPILEEVGRTLKMLNAELKKRRIRATAVAAGSVAKGTFLHNDYDCDIFVKFRKKEYAGKDISTILAAPVKRVFPKAQRVHGSRDYFIAKGGINYEIVPVIDISKPEQALNITDCSPLHAKWVNSFPQIKKEIMLTKAFAKSAGAYGAESYKKGFSGHTIDILTIHYGGFLNLLRAAVKWKPKQVIDHYKVHKGKALFNLNRSKTQSALVVIDPIEPGRNTAAALGEEKMHLFMDAAGKFLRKPSLKFFIRKDVTEADLKKRAGRNRLFLLDVAAHAGKDDVVGAKLLKACDYIARLFAEKEFRVLGYGWEWAGKEKAMFWLIVGSKPLSKTIVIPGPPEGMKEHAQNFRKKYAKTAVIRGRLTAVVQRKYTLPDRFMEDCLKDPYVKDKVKSIQLKDGQSKKGLNKKIKKMTK